MEGKNVYEKWRSYQLCMVVVEGWVAYQIKKRIFWQSRIFFILFKSICQTLRMESGKKLVSGINGV